MPSAKILQWSGLDRSLWIMAEAETKSAEASVPNVLPSGWSFCPVEMRQTLHNDIPRNWCAWNRSPAEFFHRTPDASSQPMISCKLLDELCLKKFAPQVLRFKFAKILRTIRIISFVREFLLNLVGLWGQERNLQLITLKNVENLGQLCHMQCIHL